MNTIPKCENCGLRRHVENHPDSLLARLWRWHTGWCPGWKSYQRWLAEQAKSTTPKEADRMAGATENRVEETPLPAG
jgi:hypothetical protein